MSYRGVTGTIEFYVGDGSRTPYKLEAYYYSDWYYSDKPGAVIRAGAFDVVAYYNDGTYENVWFLADFENMPLEYGIQSVTVSYGGVSTELTVYVESPGELRSDTLTVNNELVSGIACGATCSNLMSQLISGGTVKLFNGATEVTSMTAIVGTGMTVKVFDEGGALLSERKLSVKGDVDGDGKVTTTDARMTLRKAAQLDTFTEEQTAASDLDGVAGISTSDARILLRVAANLQTL